MSACRKSGWMPTIGMCVALVLYVLVVELADLHPRGPRTPSESVVVHRGVECIAIWMLIGIPVIRIVGVKCRERLRELFVIATFPLPAGILLCTLQDWSSVSALGKNPANATLWWMKLLYVVHPLYFAMFATSILLLMMRVKSRRRREGYCDCGYDLTGNLSGICPECGTPARDVAQAGVKPHQ